MIKRLSLLVLCLVLTGSVVLPAKTSALSGSEFQSGRIIDDSKFFTGPTMSIGDIQNFLNAKVPVCDTYGTQAYGGGTRASYAASKGVSTPFTCLKSARDTVPAKSAESGLCNGLPAGSGTAAEIIFWVSQSCGINSQVLITLLQKEQSLITDDWPWPIQYRSATGYGCPDTAACDSEYYGFFNQVYNAARQFKRYGRDSTLFSYRAGFNNYIQYNPNASCGGSTVYIQNQATASLYNYTPYQPNASALANLYGTGDGCGAYGNRNFWRIFNEWFGSTYGPPDYSCKFASNIPGAATGGKVLANQLVSSGNTNFSLSFMNNTGSACMEIHTWGSSMQTWASNVATNLPAFNPADGEIISGNLYGDGRTEMIFVAYRNTGSGHIEVHTWDPSYQKWTSNIATNHPAVDPADNRVIASDVNGDGIDELVFVKYQNNGTGRIEVHTWNTGLQSWASNIATNHPAVDPAENRVISANLYGDNKDELILVKYMSALSGRIEVHTWNPGLQSWYNNIATNHPAADPANVEVVSGNVYGGAPDELNFIKSRATESGHIEIHTWAPGQQSWLSNIATGYPSL